ncbi:MAG: DHH family phosphoesterase, partial [Pseudomonadota bacterium]
MDHPFPKSVSLTEKSKRLLETVTPEDTLGVMINADPDSIASAVALKRVFWRKVKKTLIYHINSIKRTDNLAMIKLLKIEQKHVRGMNSAEITKWAIVDAQPHHDELFSKIRFDIIIDHHPPGPNCAAPFVDIREEYGANSTVMTEYLSALKIRPSPTLATALFYGIRTDTDNFTRPSTSNDLNAFRYLYPFVNIHTIKKIESSGLTKKTIQSFREAIDSIEFVKDVACIYMGKVKNPDLLVLIADFFLKLAEANWSV